MNDQVSADRTSQSDTGATKRRLPPLLHIESINLRSNEACAMGRREATRWYADHESTITCYTYDARDADGRPMRIFTAYRESNFWPTAAGHPDAAANGAADAAEPALPTYWPKPAPVLLHVNVHNDQDVRFGKDIARTDRHMYRYQGWLPLGLTTHPDGKSLHRACTIGDPWVCQEPPSIGPTLRALTAAECLQELERRDSASFWKNPPEDQWPLAETTEIIFMQNQLHDLAHKATDAAYKLRERLNQIDHLKEGDTDPGGRSLNTDLADLLQVLATTKLFQNL